MWAADVCVTGQRWLTKWVIELRWEREHFLQVLHITLLNAPPVSQHPFLPFTICSLFIYASIFPLFLVLIITYRSPLALLLSLSPDYLSLLRFSLIMRSISVPMCNSGIYSHSPIHCEGETHKWLQIKFGFYESVTGPDLEPTGCLWRKARKYLPLHHYDGNSEGINASQWVQKHFHLSK